MVAVVISITAGLALYLLYQGLLELSEIEINIFRCIGLTKKYLLRIFIVT